MRIRGYGNWCGPGWTAGKYMDAKDMDWYDRLIPAIDELDQACKNHDINIADDNPFADQIFEQECANLGITGQLFAQLVHYLGPTGEFTRRAHNIQKKVQTNILQPIQDAIDRIRSTEQEEKKEEDFITPNRPPSRLEPTMTRRDIPLIGYRPRDLIEPVVNLPR